MEELRKPGALRRQAQIRRNTNYTVRCTPETRARIKSSAHGLFMSGAEFLEWLMLKYSSGLVIVMEEGGLIEGLSKTLDARADARGAEAGERAALRVLYDRGLIDSPFPK
jgi:hypothetical protein